MLLNQGEITENEFNFMCLQAAHFARAHSIPKIHKIYSTLPTIDTTNTLHYSLGKLLSSVLNLFTLNEYVLADSFDAASSIQNIPQQLNHEGYQLVSFDIESLFTNVPLNTISYNFKTNL